MNSISSLANKTTSTKQPGCFAINLPPRMDTNRLYELFFTDNTVLKGGNLFYQYAKSILVDRTKHQVYTKLENFKQKLKDELNSGVRYHYSHTGQIPCNAEGKEGEKNAVVTVEANMNEESFFLAPVYRISLQGSPTDPIQTLKIELFGSSIYEKKKEANSSVEYSVHSYEEKIRVYLKRYSVNSYRRNPNNERCLKVPMAISLKEGKFLFNVNIFDVDPEMTFYIEMQNCNIFYDPEKTYRGDDKFEHPRGDRVLMDMIKLSYGGTLSDLRTATNSLEFGSFNSVLASQNTLYNKLVIQAKTPEELATSSARESRIVYTNFSQGVSGISKTKPHEMRDIGLLLDSISAWFSARNVTGTRLSETYNLPVFQKVN